MKLTAIALALLASAPVAMAGCQTAYAADGSPLTGPDADTDNDQCLIALGAPGNRWGWSIDVTLSSETFPVYMGAAQCDTDKGTYVGEATVEYVDGKCKATFDAADGFTAVQMHFYCSDVQEPPNGWASNGHFPCNEAFPAPGVTTNTCEVPGTVSGSSIWAILHLSVCDDGPIIEGDPHFKTWNGKWFDYMGQCDLKMLEADKFDGRNDLAINVRTKVQYDYSYVEAAAIQIGDDILEVASYGDYAVNGVDTPYLGGQAGRIGGYELYRTQVSKKKYTYDIVLGKDENITLASYKHLVSVHLNVHDDQKYFGKSFGIIGSYSGDLLARDGKTIMEPTEAFGQEWQVTNEEPMLFRSARFPQYPEKCVMPTPSTTQRRLGETIAEEAAKKACAHKTGASFNNCVYDVMAMGDLELADAGAM